MFQIAAIAVLAAVTSLPASAPVVDASVNDAAGQLMQRGARLRLRGEMGDKDKAQAKADYREVSLSNGVVLRFSLEIEDGAPSTTYEIAHNGVAFAHVTTDEFGAADLNLKTITDDNGGSGSIPTMAAGDEISVAGIGAATLVEH